MVNKNGLAYEAKDSIFEKIVLEYFLGINSGSDNLKLSYKYYLNNLLTKEELKSKDTINSLKEKNSFFHAASTFKDIMCVKIKERYPNFPESL